MLDLLICHGATCEKCGNNAECVRVKFWDNSFYGLLCWDEFINMVREKSQDPKARKKFAELRPQRSVTHGCGEGSSRTEGEHRSTQHGTSRTWSVTDTESNSEPGPFAD